MLVKLTLQILYLTIILIMLKEALKGLGINSKIKIIVMLTFIGLFLNYIFYGISIQTTFEVVISIILTTFTYYIVSLLKST